MRVSTATVLVVASLVLPGSACSRDKGKQGAPAPAAGASDATVSLAELTTFLDWQAEFRTATRHAQQEAMAAVEATTSVEERMAAMKKNQERLQPIVAREPFKGTRKGQAMRDVLNAFYATASFSRNEAELSRLRNSYGKELIDSIAAREGLFRQKLDSP